MLEELFKEKDNGLGLSVKELEEETGIDARAIGRYLSSEEKFEKVSRSRYKVRL